MSNSPLIDFTQISPNQSGKRNHEIDTVTIHCVVGQVVIESLGAWFARPTTRASSNYGVDKNGKIGLFVPEENRSWCSSSAENDNRAITIEVASGTSHPYAVTAAAMEGLLRLLTDICKRNPKLHRLRWKADKSLIGKPELQNMTVHRWFDNRACPGEYLYSRHSQIAAEVNRRLEADEKGDDEMTKAEIEKIVDAKIKAALEGKETEISNWARDEMQEAIERGITDGTRPGGYAKREEVAAMIVRAAEDGKKPGSPVYKG